MWSWGAPAGGSALCSPAGTRNGLRLLPAGARKSTPPVKNVAPSGSSSGHHLDDCPKRRAQAKTSPDICPKHHPDAPAAAHLPSSPQPTSPPRRQNRHHPSKTSPPGKNLTGRLSKTSPRARIPKPRPGKTPADVPTDTTKSTPPVQNVAPEHPHTQRSQPHPQPQHALRPKPHHPSTAHAHNHVARRARGTYGT